MIQDYFIPEFFHYENANLLIREVEEEVMEKDNQMGQLLIDIHHLKDDLQEQEAKIVQNGRDQDSYRNKVNRLQLVVLANETKISSLLGGLDRLKSQLTMNQGMVDVMHQNWKEKMKSELKNEVLAMALKILARGQSSQSYIPAMEHKDTYACLFWLCVTLNRQYRPDQGPNSSLPS